MRRLVMVVCASLLFVPVYMKSRARQEIPACTAFSALSSGRVSVKISGEVRHPGIYDVPVNSLAVSVIKMAGLHGSPDKYYIASVNRSPQHGSSLNIASQVDGSYLVTAGQMSVSERIVLKIPLDISAMSESDFDRLPGVGPALAKRIVVYRQKNGGVLRVEDLAAVDGIGGKKFKMLSGYF